MQFLRVEEVLAGKHDGERVAVRGWVYRKRESKQTIFLLVRDSTGVVQCTVKVDGRGWVEAERITIESSLSLEGLVKQDKRAPVAMRLRLMGYRLSVWLIFFRSAKTRVKNFCVTCVTCGFGVAG